MPKGGRCALCTHVRHDAVWLGSVVHLLSQLALFLCVRFACVWSSSGGMHSSPSHSSVLASASRSAMGAHGGGAAGKYGSSTFGGYSGSSTAYEPPRKQPHRFHSDLNERAVPAGWLSQRSASREAHSRERDAIPAADPDSYFARLSTVVVSPFEK